jgi:hypothetical protein
VGCAWDPSIGGWAGFAEGYALLPFVEAGSGFPAQRPVGVDTVHALRHQADSAVAGRGLSEYAGLGIGALRAGRQGLRNNIHVQDDHLKLMG